MLPILQLAIWIDINLRKYWGILDKVALAPLVVKEILSIVFDEWGGAFRSKNVHLYNDIYIVELLLW